MTLSTANPTTRFSERVRFYVKYRPGYPAGLIPHLQHHTHLPPHATIADIGSGTGLLTALFLKSGYHVIGVEPNEPMRQAGEAYLADYDKFISVAGQAEATTLPDHSVDAIVAGQAFHWFERDKTRVEFERILRPGGPIALIWNVQDKTEPIVAAYQAILREFGDQVVKLKHVNRAPEEEIAQFFAPAGYTHHTLPNPQPLDYEGLAGRFMSTSTAPRPGSPSHYTALRHLKQAFNTHQQNGLVQFKYHTDIYHRNRRA